MGSLFNKRWFWITVFFAVINIVGLVKIAEVMDGSGKPSLFSIIGARFESFNSLFQKKAQEVVKEISQELTVNGISAVVDGTEPAITVQLSQSLGNADIKGYIDIKPSVRFSAETMYDGIRIEGDLKPRQTYHVEILPGLTSQDGLVLKQAFAQDVTIPDYQPTLHFKVPGLYLGLKGTRIIPLEVTNLSTVKINVHRLYANNVVYFLNHPSRYSVPEDLGIELITKEIPVHTEINSSKDTYLDLKDILPQSHQGLFYVTADDPSSEANSDSKIVLVTDIGIVLKKAAHEVLVWAASLKDAAPIPGAAVKVFSKTNQLIVEGTTYENGLMHFKELDFGKDREPFAVVVSKDSDLSFLEIDANAIAETDFDSQGRLYLSAGYEGYVYSDRGVYRPGERVHLRTIVRAPGVKTPESFPVVFNIVLPDGKKFKEQSAVLDRFGSADLALDLPDYALTGEYKVELKVPGNEKSVGEAKFNVEEFVPDSLKVAVTMPAQRFKKEDVIPLNVAVAQNFGTPAAGREVKVSYRLEAEPFEAKDYKGFSFADDTRAFNFKREYLEVQKTGEDGHAAFEIKLKDVGLPASALQMSAEVTAMEVGGRGSTVYQTRSVDVYPYYIGVKKAFEGDAQLGQEVKLDYIALTPDGKKALDAPVSAQVCRIIWNNMVKKDEHGSWKWITESREECAPPKILIPKEGAGSFSFVSTDTGDHLVRFKGGKDGHQAAVKLFVEGPGITGWSKERPDRIELTTDKPSYVMGDTAKLTIKAPFAGKGLLTCATDKIFLSKTIDVGITAQEEVVPITDDFSPNAYCALTVIRSITAEKEWSSHRGYGLVPIILNTDAHNTPVTIQAPATARPHETVTMDIEAPAGKPMGFSVALVDEAILRLTNYQVPDAYKFFYGKRANGVLTSDIYSKLMPEFDQAKVTADSSPSGDRSAYNPKNFNPISAKRIKSVALYQSQIITDEQGKAHVQFEMPEFNGELKWMVIGAGDSDFASKSQAMKVVEPLVINPFLPRFLSMNDTFNVPVSISNMTKSGGAVNVTLEASDGFTFLSEKSQSITIDVNKEGVVNFTLKAPSAPQKSFIKLTAVLGTETVTRTIELSVRPPVSWTSLHGVLEIPAESKGSILIPDGWLAGTARTKLIVSAMPTLKLSGGLKYLLKYPYGCIEQTTSSVYPLLYLRDLASTVDTKLYSAPMIAQYIHAGIERIVSMQTFSGGFAMWQGEKEAYPFGSVYATDFLIEADKAGYPVPSFAKILALSYLESSLTRSDEANTLDLKAYTVYVLAKSGRVNASWIRRLQQKSSEMTGESRFYLAAALALMGDSKSVTAILGEGFPEQNIDRDKAGMLSSKVRQDAVALSIFMDLDPQNAIVPVLVARIEGAMKDDQWASTQENAQALIALGKYARYFAKEDIDFTGSIKLGDAVRTFNSRTLLEIFDMDLAGKSLEVAVAGKGKAYAYWTSEGVPLDPQAKEIDSGMKVRRSFLDREGKAVDLKTIKQGDALIVDLSIEGAGGIKNIVLEDLLPAGFEIENPRLKNSQHLDIDPADLIDPVHLDIRDDRLVLFLDVDKDTVHYRYIVRAVTKGDFILPAVKAEAMYDPSIVSVSGQGRVEVN